MRHSPSSGEPEKGDRVARDAQGLHRRACLLLAVQMAGTFTPLVLFPSETWTVFPIAPTLEGQYIIKNLVLIGAAMVVGATVRGGRMVAEPTEVARYAASAGVAEGQTRPT